MLKQLNLHRMHRRVTDSESPEIEAQLLTLAHINLGPMLFVNIATSLGAAFALSQGQFKYAWEWFGCVLALTLIRLLLLLRYKDVARRPTDFGKSRIQYWQYLYSCGLYITACLWAGIAVFAICSGNVTETAKNTLIVIMSALASGATGVIAPLKNEGRVYITVLTLPVCVSLLVANSHELVIPLLILVFWITMIFSHNNNHKVVRRSLTLQRDNHHLIDDLQELNSTLESRVAERTLELKNIAHRDALTGLPNRRALIEWMEENLNPVNPDEAAVLFLDLDRFKQINDAMGHDIGDLVLKTIANRFKEIVPSDAILGRWGGDEFLLITPQNSNTRRDTKLLAKKLIDAATAQLEINGEALGLGLSVGVAYFPNDAHNYKDVIHAADLTVAEVKRTGRGQTLTYSSGYAETQRRRFDLSSALSEAIANNKFTLVYQPIIDAKTGQIAAFEALTRWRHPTFGNIDREEFIRLAEETDRIDALGEWVLRTACTQVKLWGEMGYTGKIAVNVSIKQLLHKRFIQNVKNILASTQLSPSLLALEVTESLFNDEYLEAVTELNKLGIEIHIDDFGTGYSSLSRLHQFPVNTIKIDQSFVAQMHTQGVVIIESAIMIAQHLKLEVIAEGVETLEQAQILHKLGVNYMQGYYFSLPESAPHFRAFEAKWISG